jgi:hypothetical protein
MSPKAVFNSLLSWTSLCWTLPLLLALAAPTLAPEPAAAQTPCGMGPKNWCPAPAGDPCGRHRTVDACRADPACYGMPYRGESVVACRLDARGFASNCPTVGCTSAPPRTER